MLKRAVILAVIIILQHVSSSQQEKDQSLVVSDHLLTTSETPISGQQSQENVASTETSHSTIPQHENHVEEHGATTPIAPEASVNSAEEPSKETHEHQNLQEEGKHTAAVGNGSIVEHQDHAAEETEAEEIVSEVELEEWLFVNYSRTRRPRKSAKDVVEVSLGIFIYNINEIIEKSHEMQITCALKVRWQDEFLTWNRNKKFASIKSLTVEREEVWIPDVALVNSGDMYALMMAEGILANLQSDGQVEFLPMSTITSFCYLDLTYFPFDFQSCSLRFESWTYEPHQETFKLSDDPVNLDKLKINEQWDVLKAESKLEPYCYTNKSSDSCYPGVEFTLYFKRKAAYYNVNIIVPSLIIAIVEVVTFTLPTPEVMKVHISFTCLLAYAVFQTTINADMPRTSEHTPLMSIYIDLQMAFIGVALLGEGVVFICLGQAEHMRPVPRGLRKVCSLISHLILVDSSNADFEEDSLEKQEAAGADDERVTSNDQGGDDGLAPAVTALSNWAIDVNTPDITAQRKNTGISSFHTSILPQDAFQNYFRVFTNQDEKVEQTNINRSQQNRHDWLFIADVAERLTLIIYLLCISVTPLVIFSILPARYSKIPHH